ncbi:MAG: glycosyltransferase family A protein [Cyanobacteria bacterium J06632_22]
MRHPAPTVTIQEQGAAPTSPLPPVPVSVVVPLYNKAPYIERTLNSILAQTRLPTEIIVVDDGSTDDGPRRVELLNHTRIRLIRQANTGPGGARNRGMAVAQSPYVAFLDADDEWLPTFLEQSVGYLDAHPDCALTVCGHLRGPNQANWAAQWAQSGIQPGVWRLPTMLSPRHYKPNLDLLLMGTMVCKRSVLQQLGGFYSKHGCNYGEDVYLWLQVILNYPIYRSPEPLMWYHTEASDLAVWERTVCPSWPMLLDPVKIRQHCPPDYRSTLEAILTQYALIAAYRLSTRGERQSVQHLLKSFPDALNSAEQVKRIRLELLVSSVPGLRPVLRQLKRRVQQLNIDA